MDFNVDGPEGDAWLLPRTEIAARQAEYLVGLADSCNVPVSADVFSLLTAILGFTGELLGGDESADLSAYFRDGLGRVLPDAVFRAWGAAAERCRAVLRPRLDEFRGYSAPENPALVLPQLFDNGVIRSDARAAEILDEYASLLEALHARAQPPIEVSPAEEFLVALADYANYYDLIVAMKVPLDEPFLVKFSERRDLRLGVDNRGAQELVIADAHSNHVTFRVPDANVRITEFEADQPSSSSPAYGAFQSRRDEQSRSFYAHDPDRDYRIRLKFRLALLRRLQLVPYFAVFLLGALTAGLWVSRPTELGTLALIVGPTALAASVLLAREPTTLGSRLRFWSTSWLALAMLALVGTAAYLFVSGPNVLNLH